MSWNGDFLPDRPSNDPNDAYLGCPHENGTEMVVIDSPDHLHVCVDCEAVESECNKVECYPNWHDNEEEF